MEQYETLRRRFPQFFYRGYEIEDTERELAVTYHFEIGGLSSFAPRWTFPKPESAAAQVVDDRMERMIFSLGMVELVSYWKITCSPQVMVEAGSLSEEQIRWWKELYYNGLGEFFYVNHIDTASLDNFMEIRCTAAEETVACEPSAEPLSHAPGVLVPIGGGKDSVVTLEPVSYTHLVRRQPGGRDPDERRALRLVRARYRDGGKHLAEGGRHQNTGGGERFHQMDRSADQEPGVRALRA